MTDTNSNTVDVTDDLDAFSEEFFGKPAQPAKDSASEDEAKDDDTTDADDTSIADDTSATNEDDETSDDESDDNTDEDEPVEKPKKKSAQERINELTRQKREAERREADLERRFAELEARLGKNEDKPEAPATTNVTGAPTPDDKNEDGTEKYPLGEFDPQFIRDVARHTFAEEMRAVREEEQRDRAKQEAERAQAALNESWTSKLDEAEETEEFANIREAGAELVNSFADLDPAYGEYLASTIMGLEKGIEVFHYLANNLDEARRIVDAGPTQATIALGRIEGRFLNGNKDGNKVKPKVSQAPEPPKTINRGASGRFEVPGDTDDLDAFEAVFFKKKR